MGRSKPVAELPAAERALEDLLGTLLAEVPEHVEPTVAQPAVVETVPIAKAPPESGAREQLVRSVAQQALNNPAAGPIQEQAQSQRPAWTDSDFKLLLVRIGQVRFAVPLICLNSIARLDAEDDVTSLPTQPAWHRGVMRYRDQQLVLADLTELLALNAGETQGGYLLVIGEGRFGVLCDAIEEQITLGPEQVNWRQGADGQEWMLGMLPEQMCMLLDPDAIAVRLQGV